MARRYLRLRHADGSLTDWCRCDDSLLGQTRDGLGDIWELVPSNESPPNVVPCVVVTPPAALKLEIERRVAAEIVADVSQSQAVRDAATAWLAATS
jgi:hypothetical protein